MYTSIQNIHVYNMYIYIYYIHTFINTHPHRPCRCVRVYACRCGQELKDRRSEIRRDSASRRPRRPFNNQQTRAKRLQRHLNLRRSWDFWPTSVRRPSPRRMLLLFPRRETRYRNNVTHTTSGGRGVYVAHVRFIGSHVMRYIIWIRQFHSHKSVVKKNK